MNETNNNSVNYPRNLSKSELATSKNTDVTKLKTVSDAIKQELTRKNYNYSVGYCYTMDAITAYITDNRQSSLIHVLDNNYYSIRITPEEYEQYSLGHYTQYKELKDKLWDNFNDIIDKPKALIMVTDEGIYQGEPIRILKKYKDNDINKHGGKISNLKHQKTTTAIEYIQIDFFKPLFREVVEDFKNWIQLPRHLQAVLEYTKLTHPEKFKFQYKSNYDKESGTFYEISTQTVRKYFLYITDHTNNIGGNMNINKLDFWKCVNEGRLYKVKATKFTPEHYQEREPYKNKQCIDALARLHSFLVKQDLLKGINFTTCKTWYTDKEYVLSVYRKKPLKEAPDYIYNASKMEIENTETLEIDYKDIDF